MRPSLQANIWGESGQVGASRAGGSSAEMGPVSGARKQFHQIQHFSRASYTEKLSGAGAPGRGAGFSKYGTQKEPKNVFHWQFLKKIGIKMYMRSGRTHCHAEYEDLTASVLDRLCFSDFVFIIE